MGKELQDFKYLDCDKEGKTWTLSEPIPLALWEGTWQDEIALLPHLFNHFFLSVWIPMCIFCTLVITWYYIINFLLQLFQFWPLEPLLVGSKYFWLAPFFRFLSTPLLSGTIRCSRLIRYFLCFRPRISHFSKEPWFPLWRNGLRNQDLDLGAFRATGT